MRLRNHVLVGLFDVPRAWTAYPAWTWPSAGLGSIRLGPTKLQEPATEPTGGRLRRTPTHRGSSPRPPAPDPMVPSWMVHRQNAGTFGRCPRPRPGAGRRAVVTRGRGRGARHAGAIRTADAWEAG